MEEKRKTILGQAAKLINVKSLVTLVLTVVFAVLALTDGVSGQEFLTVFTVIISFYFGTQAGREGERK